MSKDLTKEVEKRSAEKSPKKEKTLFNILDKSTRKRKCPPEGTAAGTDLERVIARLDALQVSIDRLLGICLQAEQEDSSAEEVDSINSKGISGRLRKEKM